MSGHQTNSVDDLEERIAAVEVELMHARRLYQIALLNDDHITVLDEIRLKIIHLTETYNLFKQAAANI